MKLKDAIEKFDKDITRIKREEEVHFKKEMDELEELSGKEKKSKIIFKRINRNRYNIQKLWKEYKMKHSNCRFGLIICYSQDCVGCPIRDRFLNKKK